MERGGAAAARLPHSAALALLALRMRRTPMGLELNLAAARFDGERGTWGLAPSAFPMISRAALARGWLAAGRHALTMPAPGAGGQENVA